MSPNILDFSYPHNHWWEGSCICPNHGQAGGLDHSSVGQLLWWTEEGERTKAGRALCSLLLQAISSQAGEGPTGCGQIQTTFSVNRKPRDKSGGDWLWGVGIACVQLALIFSGHGGDGGGGLRPDTGSWVSQPRLLMFSGFPWAY